MAFIFFKKNKIYDAIQAGDLRKVTEFLDKGVSLKMESSYKGSLLEYAVANAKEEIVSFLINRGADLDQKTLAGATCLHTAARTGHIEIADLLLKKKPDLLNQACLQRGDTALHWAALYGQEDFAAFLISKGADPDIRNNKNRTALAVAREYRRADVCRALEKVTKKTAFPPPDPEPIEPKITEGWRKLAPEKVAHISTETEIGYRITDIFNFESRDRLRIVQNLKTKTETAETKTFEDFIDQSVLEEACAALHKLGGTASPNGIFRPRQLQFKSPL